MDQVKKSTNKTDSLALLNIHNHDNARSEDHSQSMEHNVFNAQLNSLFSILKLGNVLGVHVKMKSSIISVHDSRSDITLKHITV